MKMLCSTVRNYVGDELDWEIRMLVPGGETPRVKLGESGQLGWTSWIGDLDDERISDDIVLHPLEWLATH